MLTFHEICLGQQDRVSSIKIGDFYAFLVADGAGGTGGGTEAAELCISVISQLVINQSVLSCENLDAILVEADKALYNAPQAGETTAIIVITDGNKLFGSSVGDSESWLFSDNDIKELTEHQIRKPLLGSGNITPVSFTCLPSGKLILGTDGLFKYTSISEIKDTVCTFPSDESIPKLLDLVKYPSGRYPDDIGIIVCDGTNT